MTGGQPVDPSERVVRAAQHPDPVIDQRLEIQARLLIDKALRADQQIDMTFRRSSATSKRSPIITLVQARTKSFTIRSSPSAPE